MQRDRKYKQAHEVLEAIFERQIEFEHIDEELERIDRRSAREILVRTLRQGIDIGETPLFEMIFEKIGIGKADGDLLRIVNDKTLPMRVRAAAFSIIVGSGVAPADMQEKLRGVTMVELLAGRIRDAGLATLIDEAHTTTIGSILRSVPYAMRGPLLAELESARHDASIPASLLYRHAAGALDPASDATIYDALVDDAQPGGIALLEQVIAGIEDYGAAGRAATAVAQLKERIAAGARRVPEGRAFLLPIFDGYAAVQLEIANSDGSSTFASFVMNAGQIEHCVVEIDEKGSEPRNMPPHASEADLATAAAVLLMTPVPERLRQSSAIAILQTIEPRPIPHLSPAARCTRDELAALFTRAEYEGWRLLPEEFEARAITPPDEWNASEEWIAASAKSLDDTEVCVRLVRDARFMSIWHALREDNDAAALMARAALDVERNFVESPLVLETLRVSVERAKKAFEDGPIGVQDEDDEGEGIEYEEYAAFAAAMTPFVETIREQIRTNTPPVTRATHDRLVKDGIPEAEAVRILALMLRSEMTVADANDRPFDAASWERRLSLLPDIDAAIDFVG